MAPIRAQGVLILVLGACNYNLLYSKVCKGYLKLVFMFDRGDFKKHLESYHLNEEEPCPAGAFLYFHTMIADLINFDANWSLKYHVSIHNNLNNISVVE